MSIQFHCKQTGQMALQGFFRLAELWQLSREQQQILLGSLPDSTYFKYKKLPEVSLGRDLIERISYLMGIEKNLKALFGSVELARNWVHQPNQLAPFHGKTAIELMLGGSLLDIAAVRRYLDRWLG
ncbi:MbcA/ParS/Xre antitoxin family protein [Dongshaea marina]|uniref:MbcA/ParS/Xre antitoxin family protein n=1 Tax=Dongshaea marina TaxID=2047966 RepID=UPI0018FF4A76|nr:MbcA/ParS/Xre antitoxin family protein [Dongshaea marina]